MKDTLWSVWYKVVFVLVLIVAMIVGFSHSCDQYIADQTPNGTTETIETIDEIEESLPIESQEKIETETDKGVDTQAPEPVSLGEFRLTGYCGCEACCGQWSGSPTASGVMPKANHTIAVDTSVIPFGTKVIINGHTYVSEDTGSVIRGNRIDIYFDDHQEALNFGVQYAEVFVKSENLY